VVSGAVFSKDERRILTWSEDNTARLWDAATGARIGPPLTHNSAVSGAVFSKDEHRILTWGLDNTARLWDVEWAMRDVTQPGFVEDLCRKKLVGASIPAQSADSKVQVGVRHIDAQDTANAPILLGHEGEDVCAPPPTTWETLLSLLRLPFQ
jgi:WD40 repeat protein